MKYLTIYSNTSALIDSKEIDSTVAEASFPYVLTHSDILDLEKSIKIPLTCIDSISSNGSVCFAVSATGRVFGWGADDEGLLCQGPQTIETPTEIKNLPQVSKLALSHDHVAAITSAGALMTWGSRPGGKLGDSAFVQNSPRPVPSAQSYEATSVVCGSNYTALLTSGGYLMIYGSVSHNHLPVSHQSPRKSTVAKESLPYSNPTLDLSPVVQVAGSKHFILALTESQDLFVFDGCMSLTKLPVPESGFESVLAGEDLAVGLSMTEVIVWSKEFIACSKFECPVKTWNTSRSKVFEDFRAWTWGERFIVGSESLEPLELEPDTSDFLVVPGKVNRKSTMDSPLLQKSLVSPQSRKESLMRLFPGNEGEKIIAKIMKCQEEFSNKTLLRDTFRKFVHPLVKSIFFQVKEYASKKKIFVTMKNTARIFCVSEKIHYKRFLNRFLSWKRTALLFKTEKRLSERFEKLLNRKRPRVNKRKAGIFYKRFEDSTRRVKIRFLRESFSVVSLVYNKDRAARFVLRTMTNNLVVNNYERWKKVYMSKLVFNKSLEENSFFCVTSWLRKIFFILMQEYQSKEIYLMKSSKGLEKLSRVFNLLQVKSGIVKFKSVLIISKANKLQKQVLLRRLVSTLFILFRSRLKSSVHQSYFMIKSYVKPLNPQSALVKIKFTKNRVIKSQQSYKKTLEPLQHLLNHALRSTYDSIFQYTQVLARHSFYSFLFKTNEIICKSHFKQTLQAMTLLKIFTGLGDSFQEYFNSDTNTQGLLEEISNFKPCNSGSVHLSSFDNSPRIHEQAPSAGNSPKSVEVSEFPTSFRSGELIKYQKFLINKKKLEMIKEDSFYENGKIFVVKKPKNKKSKSKIVKPPWKPSSISSNFVYQPKTQSAIEKGLKYYEARVQRTAKHLSMINVSKLDDTALRMFMKRKHSSKDSDGFEHKSSASPFLYSIDNGSPGLALEGLVEIGVAIFISNSFLRKCAKRVLTKALSKFAKLIGKKLNAEVLEKTASEGQAVKGNKENVEIAENGGKKIEAVRNEPRKSEEEVKNRRQSNLYSWETRMVNIGLEKLRFLIVNKKRKIFSVVKRID